MTSITPSNRQECPTAPPSAGRGNTSSPPGIKNTPYGVFFIPDGVAVWTKRSQSVIAGFGASVDENEPSGEV